MIHGVVNIYKEKGFTSHDVVAKLRRIVGQKKIGHTGTLDPDAVGVLPVCLGKATKLCDMLTEKDKTYETVLLLGKTTDTQDISGEVLEERSTEQLEEEVLKEIILSFVGDYEQVPPMYSALKVGGKKLYELAREGKEVERKARAVKIHHIQIKEIALPRIRMEVKCSKGTYIRTLCHDIGKKAGCGACMEELIRTEVERFQIQDSLTLGEVEELVQKEELKTHLIAIDEMLSDREKVYLKPDAALLVRNGNTFVKKDILWETSLEQYEDEEQVLVYDDERNFIAVYEYKAHGKYFKIVKMFFDGREQ